MKPLKLSQERAGFTPSSLEVKILDIWRFGVKIQLLIIFVTA